jgi:hypothetical protein
MKLRLGWMVFLLGFLATGRSGAADLKRIAERYQAEFHSGYTEGHCGQNINGFLMRLIQSRVDISCVVGFLADGGGDVSVYHARNPHGVPERRTWFHHYFIVIPTHAGCTREAYQPRTTDQVVDFDFGNEPRLVPFREYLETMWLSRRLHSNPAAVRTDFSAGITSFQVVDATRALSARTPDERKQSVVIEKLRLRETYLSILGN